MLSSLLPAKHSSRRSPAPVEWEITYTCCEMYLPMPSPEQSGLVLVAPIQLRECQIVVDPQQCLYRQNNQHGQAMSKVLSKYLDQYCQVYPFMPMECNANSTDDNERLLETDEVEKLAVKLQVRFQWPGDEDTRADTVLIRKKGLRDVKGRWYHRPLVSNY